MGWITLTSVDEGNAEYRLQTRHIVCYYASVIPVDGELPEKTIVQTVDGRTWSVKESVAEIKKMVWNF
jgi:hypothetical protein